MDNLSIPEIIEVAKVLQLLGVPADIEGYGKAIRICEAATAWYRADLTYLQREGRNHE